MPVAIGNVGTAGDHAAVADLDFMRGSDPYPGANQTIITNLNASLSLLFRPNCQSNIFVRGGHHIYIITQFDWRTKNLYMPGSHKVETRAEVIKLRPQEVIDVELLDSQVGFLDVIWTMVLAQKNTSISEA